MTEEELFDLCKEPVKKKGGYWTAEIYGFGPIIRKYGFYPKMFPLNIYFAHGITLHEKPARHELNNKAPVMLYFSPRLVNAFNRISDKPCFCLIAPNVYYRRTRNVQQVMNPSGSLAFFAHTTPAIENKMDVSEYARQLRSLPEKYQPVSVCLHYHDINKGVHSLFQERGFNVVTVGHPYHEDFIARFYDMIKCYRYLTSNDIGSYTFYGPEAGVPFFLYGNGPDLYNHGDPNIESGSYTSYKETGHYHKVRDLFLQRHDFVTPEQRLMVEKELGVYNSISRMKLALILYATYLLYIKGIFKKKVYKVFKLMGLFGTKGKHDILSR